MENGQFRELLKLGTGASLAYNLNETFIDAFLRQAGKTPEATAVVDESGSITYKELDSRSNALALELLDLGVKSGDFVAVKLPRVKEFLVAVIGIWKAGGAYMPVDPTYPAERVRYMLEDSGAKVTVDESWLERLRDEASAQNNARPDGVAIIIYTSGSTGRPKGVLNTHRGVRGLCNSMNFGYQYLDGEVIAEIPSFSYVISCSDLFPPLIYGHTVFILSHALLADIPALDRYIREKGITIITIVPQIGIPLVSDFNTPLRMIGMGGAKVELSKQCDTRIISWYGLSETCSAVSFWDLPDKSSGNSPMLGRPMPGVTIVLEDEDGNPVSRGEIGEVCIASPQVAAGYWHNEELTEKVFVRRPWSEYRVFRSGDLARWNGDGVLEFHGRRDDMVKIRGNRVELGEVESALLRVEGVIAGAVAMKEVCGESVLCGYYVAQGSVLTESISTSMSEFLPPYMIPSFFVRMESLPKLPNGKLDRLSLPVPEMESDTEAVAPESEFEMKVFPCVASVLGMEDFGVATNLISMGMTSLRAIRMSSLLKGESGLYISQTAILAHPYIRDWEVLCQTEEAIEPAPVREYYPLSDSQLGVYLDWERNRVATQYNLPFVLKFPSGIDAERLVGAVTEAVDTHSHLKVHLAERDGRVVQLRRDGTVIPVALEYIDFEPDAEFFRSKIRPFNLFEDDLARFGVYVSPTACWLFMDIHHIVFDGISTGVFLKALARCYDGEELLAEQVSAFDYALHDEKIKESEVYRASEQYFASVLEGTEPFAYPALYDRKATGVLATTVMTLPRKGISESCRSIGVTENSFFATALMQVLHRFSREDDIQITTVSSGRSMTGLSDSVGMFVRTLPLVCRSFTGTISDSLHRMQSDIVSLVSNQRCSFASLAEKYGLRLEVMYVYQGDLVEDVEIGGVKPERISLSNDSTIVPLTIKITPSGTEYEMVLEYDAGRYAAEEMEVLVRTLCCLCTEMSAADPAQSIQTLPLVTVDEEKRLVALGTGEKLDYDRSKTFVDLFTEQAKKTPDNIAVVDKESQLTYKELDEQSNAVAHWLIEEYGIQPNDFVAVMLPRRKEFVTAVLGIMKAGGAYVPIDPEYPEERRRFMTEDCEAKVVIDESVFSNLSFLATHIAKSPINCAMPDVLAYMIYTSGSTGVPKGVMIPHSAYSNYLTFYVRQQQLTSEDRMGCHRSFTFDASLEDLFPILAVGGELHIMPEEIRLDLPSIRNFIEERGITCASFTTSLGELLLREYPDLPLRYMVVSGEKLNPQDNLQLPLWNFYGPTECTVDCVTCLIEPGRKYEEVPIGKTVPNLCSMILDMEGNLVPRGVAGELCIAGPQLANGYWHRPELTAEKFVDCRYIGGEKMYRTGDLVRWNEDGQLEYIGRIDNQVKLRGFRIELGEIESAAMKIEGISQAVAVVKNDILCLYYTGEIERPSLSSTKTASQSESSVLREILSQTLAEYMVPTVYIKLETMPLTPNGKIDRKALPEPEITETETVKSATPMEQNVYDVVSATLNLNNFGVTSDLVSLGMTSIAAMRLSMKLQQRFGVSFRMTELMSHPTVRELAELIEISAEGSSQYGALNPIQEHYPLTENQKGVYIDWEGHREGLQYNVPYALGLKDIEAVRLAAAITKVIEAHPILNMRLAEVGEEIMQARDDARTAEVTLSQLPPEVCRDRESIQSFLQGRVRPFDLFHDTLYRFEIYTTPQEGEVYLFKDIHHIVTDGLSEGRLLEEILSAYEGKEIRKESYTFYDYSLESTPKEDDETYFKELIGDTAATVYPRSKDAAGRGRSRTVSVEIAKESIENERSKQGVTASNYILHALLQVLRSITREERVLIAAVSNGRSYNCIQQCQGFFVKTLPVLSEASAQDLQRQFITSISHEEFPLTKIVESTGIHPEILYAYEGELYGEAARREGIESISLALDTPKMPLCITVNPDNKDSYIISAEYDDSLYTERDMLTLLKSVSTMATEGRLVTEEEERHLIELGTGERLDYDKTKTFVDLFMEQAKKTPDNVAVFFNDRRYTYRQVDDMTDELARMLVREGVMRETVVGVMTDRSERMVLYPLAVMKAGGTYMPLDITHPAQRLQSMCEDADVRIILSEDNHVEEKLPGYAGMVIKEPENHIDDRIGDHNEIHLPKTSPDDRFVILYTSGSTGRPKGVELEYRGIVNFCHWYVKEFDMTETDRSLAYSSFSFDAHMMDIYPALSCGSSVYIVPTELRLDVGLLNGYMERNGITIAFLTTRLGHLFASTVENSSLRLLSVGGERLMPVRKPRYRLYNAGGPTESTIYAFCYPIEEDYTTSVIGCPLDNVDIYVVDNELNLVPLGQSGEMLIGGVGVGRGYLNRPELTKERFVSWKGKKVYRTGDLVRWNEEGQLEYIGRIDNQVKLRGFRIELGEIESAAIKVEGISRAVAVVKNDTLCLYYTGEMDKTSLSSKVTASQSESSALREILSQTLAEYMVPAIYVKLDAMPLTTNGKTDRKALPEPDVQLSEYVAPDTFEEMALCAVLGEVLGIQNVGVTDNLKRLGLTSVNGMRVMLRLEQLYSLKLSFGAISKAETVRDIIRLRNENLDECGSWFGGFEPSKPVIVLLCGVISDTAIVGHMTGWRDKYNIYVFLPVFKSWPDYMEICQEETLRRYEQQLDKDVVQKERIKAFIGFSFGGELAHHLAYWWNKKYGCSPMVLMGDTRMEIDVDSIIIQKEVRAEIDDITKYFQHKYFAGLLRVPFPKYSGRVMLFSAVQADCALENEEKWREWEPDIDIIRVEDSHEGLYGNGIHYALYLREIDAYE